MSLLETGVRDYAQWLELCIPDTAEVRAAAELLERQRVKIVLVVADGKLRGTISDGDIRRGLLKGVSLNEPVTRVLNSAPFVVPYGMEPKLVHQLMKSNGIWHVPTVDKDGLLTGLMLQDTQKIAALHPNTVVIMAGGLGTRLRPHTEQCPKPLLEVGGKPMLAHIIERARGEGFTHFVIALGYLGSMIQDYFGNGFNYGVRIQYVEESKRLGTAGALGLIQPPTQPIIVTNGDVITDISYSQFLQFHKAQQSDASMAVCLHEWRNPFGVVQIERGDIVGFEEKPVSRSYINAGVYVLEPKCVALVSGEEHLDMPDLFNLLRKKSFKTTAFPMHEPWIDVGRPSDWAKANEATQHIDEGKDERPFQ